MYAGEDVANWVGSAIIFPEKGVDVGHDALVGFRLMVLIWEAKKASVPRNGISIGG